MEVVITPRGFANHGLDQVERMKSKGLRVHYDVMGKVYIHKEFRALSKGADAIIVGMDKMGREMMEGCPNLKAVCRFDVGTDNIDPGYVKERNIHVGRYVRSNSRFVAEYVPSVVFMEVKSPCASVGDVKRHGQDKPTGKEIRGKRLGITGLGMIDKYLAEYTYGCGMGTYACDALAIAEETARQYHAQTPTLEDVLTDCDYISLHVPFLESTRNMISTEEFRKMKKDACLLNAACGGVVDKKTLYEALRKKEI